MSGDTIYGTTWSDDTNGTGVVFSVQTNGNGYKIVHNFKGSDGAAPNGAVTLSGTTLYGTTSAGGANTYGGIFSVQTNGTGFTLMHSFSNGDGIQPSDGSLVLSGTTLYGVTYLGGLFGYGTVYSIQTNGSSYTILHNFKGTDGQQSNSPLILSGDTLYGMTGSGGVYGYGVIFSLNTNGTGYKVLHNFNDTVGSAPVGYLTLSGSTLYGVAGHGGANAVGIVFSIQTNGNAYTDMHDFKFGPTDGMYPVGGLVLSGNTLYGITSQGGDSYGLIYSIQTNGSNFTGLFSQFGFDVVYTGMWPDNAVTLSGNTLYGTTSNGGSFKNYGVVFGFSIPAVVDEINSVNETAKVYPNPSNGIFRIEQKSEKESEAIEVYNMFGEKVYSNHQISKSSNHQIDLSSQPNGIYLYRLLSENGSPVAEGKLVIQK